MGVRASPGRSMPARVGWHSVVMEPFVRAQEPPDGDERGIALGWLAFHRDALAAKCCDLTDDQLVARSAPPSALSLLGVVRHMAEMERAYGQCQEVKGFCWSCVWVLVAVDEGVDVG